MRAKSQTEMRKYRFLNNEMTQEELGKRIGLSRQSICDIETGKRLPTLRQAYKISKLLNTTILIPL
jgi:putative transcriptional regulator